MFDVNLSLLTIDQLRAECKRVIESLERWLRDLIDYELHKEFGINYMVDAKLEGGQNVIPSDVRGHIDKRIASEPARFPRKIDAIQLDHAIAIVCRIDNWKAFFGSAMQSAL